MKACTGSDLCRRGSNSLLLVEVSDYSEVGEFNRLTIIISL